MPAMPNGMPAVTTMRSSSLAKPSASATRAALITAIVPEVTRFKMAVISAARVALADGFATEEDRIVVTAGIPFGMAGTTNILRVAICNERAIYEGGDD